MNRPYEFYTPLVMNKNFELRQETQKYSKRMTGWKLFQTLFIVCLASITSTSLYISSSCFNLSNKTNVFAVSSLNSPVHSCLRTTITADLSTFTLLYHRIVSDSLFRCHCRSTASSSPFVADTSTQFRWL